MKRGVASTASTDATDATDASASAGSEESSAKRTRVLSLAERFARPAGEWRCDACMVPNVASVAKCMACETPNPNPPSTSSTAPSAAPSSTTSSSAAPAPTFVFSAPGSTSAASSASPPTATSTTTTPFSFTNLFNKAPAAPAAAPASTDAASSATSAPASSFFASFFAKSAAPATSETASTSVPPTESPATTSTTTSTTSTNGTAASSVFKFGGGSNPFASLSNPFASSTFAIPSFGASASTGNASFSSIASAATGDDASELEGGGDDDGEVASFTPASSLTESAGINELFKNRTQESTGDEADTVLARHATKVFLWKEVPKLNAEGAPDGTETKWVEHGVGEVHLNLYDAPAPTATATTSDDAAAPTSTSTSTTTTQSTTTSGKRARLVMRTDKTRRLVLNVPVLPSLAKQFQLVMERNVRFATVDPQRKPALYLFKLKTKDEAARLFADLQRLVSKVEDQQA